MRIEGDSPARLVLEKGEVVEVLGMQIIYRKKGNILTKKHGYTFQTPKILDGMNDLQIIYNLECEKKE